MFVFTSRNERYSSGKGGQRRQRPLPILSDMRSGATR